MLSADRRAELLEWARETGALVIEDDYDAEALGRIRPQGEAAGLHLLLRLPAGQEPGVISTAAETHGIMLEKAAWHWADPDTARPALLVGYGSVREDDLARGIESLRVSTKP